jgi:hypothetical protein
VARHYRNDDGEADEKGGKTEERKADQEPLSEAGSDPQPDRKSGQVIELDKVGADISFSLEGNVTCPDLNRCI